MDKLTLMINNRGTEYLEDVAGNVVKKRCTECKEMKVVEEYQKNKLGLGGRAGRCVICTRHIAQEKRDKARLDKSRRTNTTASPEFVKAIIKEMRKLA